MWSLAVTCQIKDLTSSFHHTFLWDSRCLTAVDPSCPTSTPPQTLCMAHKDWLWHQMATLWWQTLGTIVLKCTVIYNSTLLSKNKYLHLFLKAAAPLCQMGPSYCKLCCCGFIRDTLTLDRRTNSVPWSWFFGSSPLTQKLLHIRENIHVSTVCWKIWMFRWLKRELFEALACIIRMQVMRFQTTILIYLHNK